MSETKLFSTVNDKQDGESWDVMTNRLKPCTPIEKESVKEAAINYSIECNKEFQNLEHGLELAFKAGVEWYKQQKQ